MKTFQVLPRLPDLFDLGSIAETVLPATRISWRVIVAMAAFLAAVAGSQAEQAPANPAEPQLLAAAVPPEPIPWDDDADEPLTDEVVAARFDLKLDQVRRLHTQ